MKCIIIGGQNTKNYGSLMLVENFVNYSNYSEYVILCNELEETKRRFSHVINNEKKLEFRLYKKNKNKIANKLKLIKGMISKNFEDDNFTDLIKDCNDVIFLGGDDLSEDYGIGGLIYQTMYLYKASKMNKNVYVCGQTIGPFKSWRKAYIKKILSNVNKISVRDPITYKYLKENLKVNTNVVLSADLAFLDLKSKITYQFNEESNFVVLCPSSIVWKYSNNPDKIKYTELLTKLCEYIIREKDMKILILPHVSDSGSGDKYLCEELEHILKSKGYYDKFEYLDQELYPVDCRTIFGKSKFVITGRMHPAISTISTGKPVISMAYSVKYKGIIGEYAGLEDLIVDVRYQDWEKMYNILVEMIENIENNYDEVKSRIKKAHCRMLQNVQKNF